MNQDITEIPDIKWNTGKERLAVIRELAEIRQLDREKALEAANKLQVSRRLLV